MVGVFYFQDGNGDEKSSLAGYRYYTTNAKLKPTGNDTGE